MSLNLRCWEDTMRKQGTFLSLRKDLAGIQTACMHVSIKIQTELTVSMGSYRHHVRVAQTVNEEQELMRGEVDPENHLALVV